MEAKTYDRKPKQILLPDDPNKTGEIMSMIKIEKGSREVFKILILTEVLLTVL